MTVRLLAFTERGFALAQNLAHALGGQAARCAPPVTLGEWTAAAFEQADALVYVGAVGIAVRAIAPHVRSKTHDPAVVAVDELGRFVVPLLSGHLGGANDLARQIGAVCGAQPVITTATDLHDVFAVDEWAKRQNCTVLDPRRIKTVSAKLLEGQAVVLNSPWTVAGTPPHNVKIGPDCDFELTVFSRDNGALRLVPRIAVLGVGCRKGTSQQALETAFEHFLKTSGLCREAFFKVCSIDLKKDEPGLLAFCAAHGLKFETFDADCLRAIPGEFSSSEFVRGVTGVDNVCERSAVAGSAGALCRKKQSGDGITMAAALAPFTPDWRWKYE